MYCSMCGAENRDDAEFCYKCGSRVGPPAGNYDTGRRSNDTLSFVDDFRDRWNEPGTEGVRPTSVTLVSIYFGLNGLMLLVASIWLLILTMTGHHIHEAAFLGLICLIMGVIYGGLTYLIYKGWHLAWYITIGLAVLSIITSLMTLGPIMGILICIIIVMLYLRPKVKQFYSV